MTGAYLRWGPPPQNSTERLSKKTSVLDASALLALLNRETGHEEVARVISRAAISAVNLS